MKKKSLPNKYQSDIKKGAVVFYIGNNCTVHKTTILDVNQNLVYINAEDQGVWIEYEKLCYTDTEALDRINRFKNTMLDWIANLDEGIEEFNLLSSK